jgi:hypothetical protein
VELQDVVLILRSVEVHKNKFLRASPFAQAYRGGVAPLISLLPRGQLKRRSARHVVCCKECQLLVCSTGNASEANL